MIRTIRTITAAAVIAVTGHASQAQDGLKPLSREEALKSDAMSCVGARDDGSCLTLISYHRSDDGIDQFVDQYLAAEFVGTTNVIYRVRFDLFQSEEAACAKGDFGYDSVEILGVGEDGESIDPSNLKPMPPEDVDAFKFEIAEKMSFPQGGLLCAYRTDADEDGFYRTIEAIDGVPVADPHLAYDVSPEQMSAVVLRITAAGLNVTAEHLIRQERLAQEAEEREMIAREEREMEAARARAEIESRDAARVAEAQAAEARARAEIAVKEAEERAAAQQEEYNRWAEENRAAQERARAERAAADAAAEERMGEIVIDRTGLSPDDVDTYVGVGLDLDRKMTVYDITHLSGDKIQLDYTTLSYGSGMFPQRPRKGTLVGEIIGGKLVVNGQLNTGVLNYDPENGALVSHADGIYLPISLDGEHESVLKRAAAEPFRNILRSRGFRID